MNKNCLFWNLSADHLLQEPDAQPEDCLYQLPHSIDQTQHVSHLPLTVLCLIRSNLRMVVM